MRNKGLIKEWRRKLRDTTVDIKLSSYDHRASAARKPMSSLRDEMTSSAIASNRHLASR